MKVVFKGIKQVIKKGCVPCGRKAGQTITRSSKFYIFPNGVTKMVYKGQVYEVSDEDGRDLIATGDFEEWRT